MPLHNLFNVGKMLKYGNLMLPAGYILDHIHMLPVGHILDYIHG